MNVHNDITALKSLLNSTQHLGVEFFSAVEINCAENQGSLHFDELCAQAPLSWRPLKLNLPTDQWCNDCSYGLQVKNALGFTLNPKFLLFLIQSALVVEEFEKLPKKDRSYLICRKAVTAYYANMKLHTYTHWLKGKGVQDPDRNHGIESYYAKRVIARFLAVMYSSGDITQLFNAKNKGGYARMDQSSWEGSSMVAHSPLSNWSTFGPQLRSDWRSQEDPQAELASWLEDRVDADFVRVLLGRNPITLSIGEIAMIIPLPLAARAEELGWAAEDKVIIPTPTKFERQELTRILNLHHKNKTAKIVSSAFKTINSLKETQERSEI